MPTYDYSCNKCKETVEVFHNMSEQPKVKCPGCGKKMIKQIGAGGGLIFKGPGFYQTDYKNKN